MKKNILHYLTIVVIIFAGCNIIDPEPAVFLSLSDSELNAEGEISVIFFNNTDKTVHLLHSTLYTIIEKRTSDGKWHRLGRGNHSAAVATWYTRVASGSTSRFNIRTEYLETYVDNAKGTYRAVFEYVVDENYEDMKVVRSNSFTVI